MLLHLQHQIAVAFSFLTGALAAGFFADFLAAVFAGAFFEIVAALAIVFEVTVFLMTLELFGGFRFLETLAISGCGGGLRVRTDLLEAAVVAAAVNVSQWCSRDVSELSHTCLRHS